MGPDRPMRLFQSPTPAHTNCVIDWVQDASREQARRKSRRKRAAGLFERGQNGWRYRLWASYDAAQGWIVVTIIGAAIGLNAAFLNIITEWLSDIKLGYCTTAFYLNEKFCCWGEDNGENSFFFFFRSLLFVAKEVGSMGSLLILDFHVSGCANWHRWTGFEPLNYLLYLLFAVRPPLVLVSAMKTVHNPLGD